MFNSMNQQQQPVSSTPTKGASYSLLYLPAVSREWRSCFALGGKKIPIAIPIYLPMIMINSMSHILLAATTSTQTLLGSFG